MAQNTSSDRYIMWSPIPKRPWGVHMADGRVIRRFNTVVQAHAYLRRLTLKQARKTRKPPMTHEERQALIHRPMPVTLATAGRSWGGVCRPSELTIGINKYRPRLDELDGDAWHHSTYGREED